MTPSNSEHSDAPADGGGYDAGYSACPMFWPDRPASLLLEAAEMRALSGGVALDLGCGEGTNAIWLSEHGYIVDAMDISPLAVRNATWKYPSASVLWSIADACEFTPEKRYDLIVAYGLLHCLPESKVSVMIDKIKSWTAPDGLVVLATFNDRSQDLDRAHPGFNPTLLPHSFYTARFKDWSILVANDRDLHETHPHNNIAHHHSMTRILARRSE